MPLFSLKKPFISPNLCNFPRVKIHFLPFATVKFFQQRALPLLSPDCLVKVGLGALSEAHFPRSNT